jgi:hypothetical protein
MAASPVPTAIKMRSNFSPRGTALIHWNGMRKLPDLQRCAADDFCFWYAKKILKKYIALTIKTRMSPWKSLCQSERKRDEKDIQEIRNRPNVVVAIGNRIVTNAFDRWLKEMYSVDGKSKHVYWIHTKFMLVDPLGATPIVITGSANFSKASTDTNDENMLVIKAIGALPTFILENICGYIHIMLFAKP